MACAAVDIAPAVPFLEHTAEVLEAQGRDQGRNGRELGAVRMAAQGQGDVMGKAFVDKGRMMGQHDDKSIFRNLSQRFPDILFPFFGKGFITLGKAVISGGDIKRPAVAAIAAPQALAAAAAGLEGGIAQYPDRRVIEHGCNRIETAVILVIAIAEVDAVREAAGIGFEDGLGLGQQGQFIDEVACDFQAVHALCRYGIEGFLQSPGTEKEPHVQVRELADFIAVEIIGQVLVFQDMVGRIQIAFAQEIARSAGGESRHGDQRRQAFEERPARHARRAPLTPTPSPAAPGPAEKAGYGDDDQAGKGQETGQQPDQAGHGLAVIETFPARRDEAGKEVFIMVETGCR